MCIKNIKEFWNKHEDTIKDTVTLAIIPTVVIISFIVLPKLEQRNKDILEIYQNGYIVR